MNKLTENIIEITLVWARLTEERDLKEGIDSLDVKESIIKYAQDFESKYRDITWDGDAFDYYLIIEKYGKQRLLDDYGREVDPSKKCRNCANRCWSSWDGVSYCMSYEMTETEDDEIREANKCRSYEKGTPSCLDEDEYCPSATRGDYSPSNPWDAPGMSVKDFI